MNNDNVQLIAETLNKGKPINFNGMNKNEYDISVQKWTEIVIDLDELFKITCLNYNSDNFIKKCYNFI